MHIDSIFQKKDDFLYPLDNHETFEDYFIRTFKSNGEAREFLPVAWTSFYRRAAYAKDAGMMRRLQKELLNKLDRRKKYFTVVTWDDGIVSDLTGLDIQIFAACGPRIDFPIPLLCHAHPYKVSDFKTISCSFVGALNHPIRNTIVKELSHLVGYYISTAPHQLRKYCEIIGKSRYVLCPRGYGITSFRICEAIQYGAIPIYVSDRFAYTRGTINVVAGDGFVETIKDIIDNRTPVANPSPDFTYEACKSLIIKNIRL